MIGITDTTFRDGQQSLIATRMRTEEMLPILEVMDKQGFHSLEVWGGATFDSCLRFLKEDPWERLKKIRGTCKNTKLQMLFRGQNMLGYKAYADDVVEAFLVKAIETGIDIVRVFDALNDIRNVEQSIKVIKKSKGHAQAAISYTLSDVHTEEYYVKLAKQFEGLGADSLCIKDMAGLLLPNVAYSLVKALKEAIKLPIQVHSHYTSGVAAMSYLKAVEAGADVIDTAMSPFSMGTSQPATEVCVVALKSMGFDCALDEKALEQIASMLRPMRENAIASGLLDAKVLGVDISTLLYQVPGGMLSNLVSQLKAQKAEHRFEEVLKEIPRVRADFGYPPLVTPSSQIVGTQAVMNVITGERYKICPNETKDLVRGMYGKTPIPISDEIKKKIIGNEKTVSERPGSLIKPQMAQFERELGEFKESELDVLSYALFPSVAMEYFKFRRSKKYGIDHTLADAEKKTYPI